MNLGEKCVSVKQVYNWIEQGKIKLTKNWLCYKKHKKKKIDKYLWFVKIVLNNEVEITIKKAMFFLKIQLNNQ